MARRDDSGDDRMVQSRRRTLLGAGATLSVLVAGCSEPGGGEEEGGGEETTGGAEETEAEMSDGGAEGAVSGEFAEPAG